jgi:hypothetical protein
LWLLLQIDDSFFSREDSPSRINDYLFEEQNSCLESLLAKNLELSKMSAFTRIGD